MNQLTHSLTLTNAHAAAPLTMSSLEIAELTGKEHFHIIRDIRSMLEALGITESSFGCSYKDTTGRTLPAFNLPKDLTTTLVTGYSIPLRHRVVTRWMELEAVKPAVAKIHSKFARGHHVMCGLPIPPLPRSSFKVSDREGPVSSTERRAASD